MSVTVIDSNADDSRCHPGSIPAVGRWQPNAQGRLEEAALSLYAERGFDQTTVAEIAERAGLTERTFFRHFADKREVLFGGQDQLLGVMTEAVAAQPDSDKPLDVVSAALQSAAEALEDRRPRSRIRQQVINSHPGLRERELIKLTALADGLAEALVRRGVQDRIARLSAEAGVAVFKVAFEQWIERDDHDLAHYVRAGIDELKALTAG